MADILFSGYTGNSMLGDEASKVSTFSGIRRCVILHTTCDGKIVIHELEGSASAGGVAMRLGDLVTRNRGVEDKVPSRHKSVSWLFPRPLPPRLTTPDKGKSKVADTLDDNRQLVIEYLQLDERLQGELVTARISSQRSQLCLSATLLSTTSVVMTTRAYPPCASVVRGGSRTMQSAWLKVVL
jgi:hypothetical protein